MPGGHPTIAEWCGGGLHWELQSAAPKELGLGRVAEPPRLIKSVTFTGVGGGGGRDSCPFLADAVGLGKTLLLAPPPQIPCSTTMPPQEPCLAWAAGRPALALLLRTPQTWAGEQKGDQGLLQEAALPGPPTQGRQCIPVGLQSAPFPAGRETARWLSSLPPLGSV